MSDIHWETRVRIYDPLPQDTRYAIVITRYSLPLDLDTKIERFNWSTSKWMPVDGRETIQEGPHAVCIDRGMLEALCDALVKQRYPQ